MLTENGVQIDYEALETIFSEADVVVIGFTFTADRLLIDARANETAGPLITPVGPVNTVQERYLWLGQHRPGFGSPEDFSFFVWPQTSRRLMVLPNLNTLLQRLESAEPKASDDLREALAVFAELEMQSMRAAIEGKEPWNTIWARDASG